MLLPPTVVVVAVMMVAKIVYIMKRNNMSFFRKKKKEAFPFLVLYSHFPNRNETMFHFHYHSHSILIHTSFLSIKHLQSGNKTFIPIPTISFMLPTPP
jgi:hypothetical protein